MARFAFIILLIGLFNSSLLKAQETNDQSLSPYFLVLTEEASGEAFPLKNTAVEVNIAGVIADVKVTQVYSNTGNTPLEAVYVFPASTRAAVHAMEMVVGERVITAEIRERNQARLEYEQAKAEGRRTSLLEQQRPNVFQMNVANIMPGETVKVVMQYTELLIPEDGTYTFIYPTVVGPRYTEGTKQTASTHDQFTATPYLEEGTANPSRLDVGLHLEAGMPLQSVHSPSHQVVLNQDGSAADLRLHESERFGGNRDFIVEYCLSGEEIESGLLTYEHEDENFFLMMVQPPARVATPQIPAREYIFIVDVSGSMRGFPLDVTKALLSDLIANLRPVDRFNILFFSGGSNWLAEESLPATEANLQKGLDMLSGQRGGGGTRLLPAMQNALDLPRCEAGVSRSMVVITDGFVSVERAAFDLVRQNLNAANVFAFGIGSSVNRHLIEGLAHVGQGEPLIVTDFNEAQEQAERFRRYIQSPVLSNVNIDFGELDVYDIEPQTAPDLLAERPLIVFGKYRGEAKGNIRVSGYTGTGPFSTSLTVSAAIPHARQAALRQLWARERIRMLDDYQKLRPYSEDQLEVTRLGLKYSLMTAYTSFIAVENDLIANATGEPEQVKQPLPLPQGVSNSAVGFDLEVEGVVRRSRPKLAWTIELSPVDGMLVNQPALQLQVQEYFQQAPPAIREALTAPVTFTLGFNEAGAIISIDWSLDGDIPQAIRDFWLRMKWKADELNGVRTLEVIVEKSV